MKKRVISAVVMLAVTFTCVLLSEVSRVVYFGIIALVCAYEWCKNLRVREVHCADWVLYALIAALTVLGTAAAWLLGIPALTLLVGEAAGREILPFRGALVLVILGGGFYALLNLLYYILVIFGRQRLIFFCYCLMTPAAKLLSDAMVQRSGIPGAAASYLVTMAVLSLLFTAAAFRERDFPGERE